MGDGKRSWGEGRNKNGRHFTIDFNAIPARKLIVQSVNLKDQIRTLSGDPKNGAEDEQCKVACQPCC
jgi:hypothetical protein